MKTTVSIPLPLFEAAEAFARQNGLSRSELYSRALTVFLARADGAWITEQMNHVCETVDTGLDDFARELQARSIPREDW